MEDDKSDVISTEPNSFKDNYGIFDVIIAVCIILVIYIDACNSGV